MSVRREIYGAQSEEFADGRVVGVTMYTVWKDGVQVVGVQEQPLLQEVVEEINPDLWPSVQKEKA